MIFKPFLAALATITLAAGANAAVSVNLVSNGDFAATSLTQSSVFQGTQVTGWTSGTNANTGGPGYNIWYSSLASSKSPGAIDAVYGFGYQALAANVTGSANGGAFIALDGDTDIANAKFSQMINNLVVGQSYRLSFEWAAAQITTRTGPTIESLQVAFGNQTFSTATVNNPTGGFQGWFNVSFDYKATSTSQLLSFLSVGGPAGQPPVALLDGVNLTAVPEPATWGMMLAGFGMVGMATRKRRRTPVVAA